VTPVEASPAGAVRERAVPCVECGTSTFNHSGRCDAHRRRCVVCGTPVGPVDQWCSRSCFVADEGFNEPRDTWNDEP